MGSTGPRRHPRRPPVAGRGYRLQLERCTPSWERRRPAAHRPSFLPPPDTLRNRRCSRRCHPRRRSPRRRPFHKRRCRLRCPCRHRRSRREPRRCRHPDARQRQLGSSRRLHRLQIHSASCCGGRSHRRRCQLLPCGAVAVVSGGELLAAI
jgi:hypothetical protein